MLHTTPPRTLTDIDAELRDWRTRQNLAILQGNVAAEAICLRTIDRLLDQRCALSTGS